jgi:Spy/CpxP family protein refolding chaperone
MKTARTGGAIFWVGAAGAGRPNPEATEMRKTILAVLGGATLVLVLEAVVGSAQPPPPGERGPWRGRAEGLTRLLGLSEQQQDQVQKLMEGRRAEHQALREKVDKNRQELKQALESASPDPAAVGELAIEAHRLRQQDRALREAQDEAIRGLLTPEQRAKLDAMRALREEGMGGPPEGGRGRGLERGSGRPWQWETPP